MTEACLFYHHLIYFSIILDDVAIGIEYTIDIYSKKFITSKLRDMELLINETS